MGKLTVAKARERAFANRVAVAHGGNPLAEKRRAKCRPSRRRRTDLGGDAGAVADRRQDREEIWRQVLSQRALPAFGDRPVDAITPEDVLRILTLIWSSKPHPWAGTCPMN